MKILYIVSGLDSIGGIETFAKNVISKIDLNSYRIDFLVTGGASGGATEKDFEKKGCKIFHIDGSGSLKNRIKNKKAFFKGIKNQYDIVHIHTVLTTAFYFAYLAKKYTGAKIVVHSHTANNYEGTSFKNNLCRPLLKIFAENKIACSENSGKFLFGKNSKNVKVLFNSVATEKFHFDENIRENKRRELNIEERQFVLLIVGRLTPAKNHIFLLRVFAEFLQRNSNSILLVCGDGEERAKITSAIEEYGINGNVKLLGNRSDIGEIMSASDCFVLPSLYEGLPTVLIEAQTAGLPVLYSSVITKEVIVADNAVCLDIVDTKEWVEQLCKISKEDRKPVSVEVFTQIENSFGIDSIVKDLESYYRRLGNGKD